MRERFEEVHIHAQRVFRCADCGKRRSRRQKFYQTVNPWNCNADGTVKTRSEIYRQITAAADAWQPTTCGCAERAAKEAAGG